MSLWILAINLASAGPRGAIVGPDALSEWSIESGDQKTEMWWQSFDDPGLTKIIEDSIAANRDLAAAQARAKATGETELGYASLLPNVSFDLNGTLSPTSSRGFSFGGLPTQPNQPAPPDTFFTGAAQFKALWDVDIFLKQQQRIRAGQWDAEAARGDRDAAVIAFATRASIGYFDLVAAKQRLSLLRSQVDASRQLLEIIQLRYENGGSNAVDLLQQRQRVASGSSQLPLAEANLRSLEYQLAVGLSLPPTTTIANIADRLPALPPMPDAGIPADLIRNRPDLRAAEARLDAATARKNSAVRDLLPTLRLNGSAGWQFYKMTDLTSQQVWNVGAAVSVPIFQGGRKHTAIRQTRNAEIAAVHSYTQAAANAVLEVENALLLEQHRQSHLQALTEQLHAAELAWDEARQQYVAGTGSYITLLSAKTTRDSAELAVLDSHHQLLRNRVLLHDALGGQWPSELTTTGESNE